MKPTLYVSPDELAELAGGDLAGERRYNSPGKCALVYRAGTYAIFLHQMLDHARSVTIPDGPNRGRRPLAQLNLDASRDLAVSLVKAWAVVGDVLTFYQERIANEGYLRTATERRSVLELVRTIDYELRPGVAASTFLAFTLLDARGAPPRSLIPASTMVQSTPDPGKPPVTFESSADVPARVEWNSLSSFVPTVARGQDLGPGATHVKISGVRPGLQVGSHIVVIRRDATGAPIGVAPRIVTSVEIDRGAGYTQLSWDEPLASLTADAVTQRFEVVFLRQRAALFGHDAPDWAGLPDSTKARYATRSGGLLRSADRGATWTGRDNGLPDATIAAIVDDGRGNLYLGTDAGIFRSVDGGQTWLAAGSGLGTKKVLGLTATASGYLYASTSTGEVYRSTDNAGSWESLRGAVTLVQSGRSWSPQNGRLPRTIVRTVAEISRPDADESHLFVGTDRGVFHSENGGNTWTAANAGLPGYDPGTGTAQLAVHALAVDADGVSLFAGTDHGVFLTKDGGRSWSPASAGLPNIVERAPGPVTTVVDTLRRIPPSITVTPPGLTVYALVSFTPPRSAQSYLFAGTDQGVFVSSDHGRRWQPATRGLPVAAGATPPFVVRALAVSIDPAAEAVHLVVGTSRGVFASDDRGASWRSILTGTASAVTIDRTGATWAATPLGGFVETQWPNFQIQGSQIDLDHVYPRLVPGSWLVLQQDAPTPLVGGYPIADVVATTRNDFTRTAMISRVVTVADPQLPQFDPRQTSAYVDGESLPLWEERVPLLEPVQGAQLQVSGVGLELPIGGWLALSGKRLRARIVADLGGVSTIGPANRDVLGLVDRTVVALVVDQNGRLVAATDAGVFRQTDDGWAALGLADEAIHAAASTARGLIAGTDRGVFRLNGNAWENIGLIDRSVFAFAIDAQGRINAATSRGVARDDGTAWTDTGLTGTGVTALVVDDTGRLVAATPAGVLAGADASWSALDSLDRVVTTLAIDPKRRVFAGTTDGVFVYDGAAWSEFGLTGQTVQTLIFDATGTGYVGTTGAGLLHRSEGDVSWSPLPVGVANDVRALALGANGALFAGMAKEALLTTADGLVRLAWTEGPLFTLPPLVEAELDQGRLTALVGKEFADNGIVLTANALLVVVRTGQLWLLRDTSGVEFMIKKSPASGIAVYPDRPLPILASPRANPDDSLTQVWPLGIGSASGFIAALASDVVYERAAADDAPVSEVAQILAADESPSQVYTTVTLAAPLDNSYDPTTVTVCANVAPATHGETVRQEVLGSGNASAPNQRFTLKKPPLTYVAALSPSGAASTLSVRLQTGAPRGSVPAIVDPGATTSSIEWHEVASLYQAGPTERAYMVRLADDGQPSVIFGDGVKGARLLTGNENVVTSYRSGIGEVGNVGANRLTTLRTRPPGVRTVTNPVPATGGADPDSADLARSRAPSQIRALQRIISLGDYEDFAAAFAGIAKAQVRLLRKGKDKLVYLTVAAPDGGPVPADGETRRALLTAIDAYRVTTQPVQVGGYEKLLFDLEATIEVAADADREQVMAALHDRLLRAFSFDQRAFGQDVRASDVVALIQDVPGVVATRLEALFLHGNRRERQDRLTARSAEWGTDGPRPAQLLVLNAVTGLKLTAGTL